MVGGDPTPRQAGPPRFRDVLRGRVGQECEVHLQDGIWSLSFSPPGQGETLGDAVAQRQELGGRIKALYEEMERAQDDAERNRLIVELIRVQSQQKDRTLAVQSARILVAVGEDFVQLREADGTERYVPLGRVDVVVSGAGK